MLTLNLNGSEVDLPPDAEVALTLWAHDLRNSATREATFSETFTLPPSARNSRALGTPQQLNSQTDAPYTKLPAILRAGGLVVLDGVAVLEQVTGEGYEITLYSPTADLFALVGSRKLRDLDLSRYDHVLNYANVAAAQGNDYTHGYTYPLADDGRLTKRATATVSHLEVLPAVFVHTLLKQMVAECLPGYALTGSLLTDARYRQLVLPRARPWPALRQAQRDALALTVRRDSDATWTQGNGESTPLAEFPQIVSAGSQAQWETLASYRVPAGLPCDVRAVAQLLVSARSTNLYTAPGGTVPAAYVRLVADPHGPAGFSTPQVGASYTLFEGFLLATGPPLLQPVRQYVSIDATFTHLPPGATVYVQLLLRRNVSVTLHASSTLVLSVGERTYAGGPVQIEAGLPDLAQADLLQLVANTFQVIYQADPVFRTLRADLFTDVERNRAKAVDWTAKLDRTSRPATSFRLEGYAQRNRYAYDSPPEEYNVLLLAADQLSGEGILPVADATIAESADAYIAPVFRLQAHQALNGLLALAWLPAVEPNGAGYELYDNTRAYTTADAPVLYEGRYWKFIYSNLGTVPAGTTPPANFNFGGGSYPIWAELAESEVLGVLQEEIATVALLSALPGVNVLMQSGSQSLVLARGLTGQGLGWAEDLLPTYYPTLQALLVRARILGLYLTLNAADISQLDYTIPVRLNVPYWQGVGPIRGEFYLNLIDQYLPGQAGPVMVELVRLGEPVAGLAPAATELTLRPVRSQFTEQGLPFQIEDRETVLIEEQ